MSPFFKSRWDWIVLLPSTDMHQSQKPRYLARARSSIWATYSRTVS